jgi:hypothetical protein
MTRNHSLLVLVAALLLGASPAFPHARLVRASPPVDGTVQSAPREVAIYFSESITPADSTITVQDAAGTRVDEGNARVDSGNRRVIRVSVKPLAAGTYKVIWRIRSVDTHRTEGTFTFRVP